jgi:hypothetical protein
MIGNSLPDNLGPRVGKNGAHFDYEGSPFVSYAIDDVQLLWDARRDIQQRIYGEARDIGFDFSKHPQIRKMTDERVGVALQVELPQRVLGAIMAEYLSPASAN